MIKGQITIIHAVDTNPKVVLEPSVYAKSGTVYVCGDNDQYSIGQLDSDILKHYEELKLQVEKLEEELSDLRSVAYGDSEHF